MLDAGIAPGFEPTRLLRTLLARCGWVRHVDRVHQAAATALVRYRGTSEDGRDR